MFRFAKAIGARRYSRPVRVLITGGGGFLGCADTRLRAGLLAEAAPE
jgi:hypothetical protein